MEECVRLGLARSIGLSNFNSQQIQRVLDVATIKPVVNQVCVMILQVSRAITHLLRSKSFVLTAPFAFSLFTFAYASLLQGINTCRLKGDTARLP
jgi:diketogulonate reductase-like aldo/keto reductase